MFFRLCSRAPREQAMLARAFRAASPGPAIYTLPDRYWPVSESGCILNLSVGVPAPTRPPPSLPAPGPRSMT